MFPNLHRRCCLLTSVLSPTLMNRNAQSPSAAHGHWRRRKHRRIVRLCTDAHTHSTIYVLHSNNRQNAPQGTNSTAFDHRRWMDILVRLRFEPLWICVKQLSTQSGQSENYSNKDIIIVQFYCFNQTFEFEWNLIEEAHLQSLVAQWSWNIMPLNSFIVADTFIGGSW